MTINEAIKGLKTRLISKYVTKRGEPDADVLLGIEALKFFKEYQRLSELYLDARLPGETKE